MRRETFVPDTVGDLEPFVRAGILGEAEIHVACTFASVDPGAGFEVLLASALAVRAPRQGSVCVDLATIRDTVVSSLESTAQLAAAQSDGEAPEEAGSWTPDHDRDRVPELASLPWPDPVVWLDAVRGSPLVAVVDEATASAEVGGRLRPLVVDEGLLYLTRYWSLERYVAADLRERSRPTAAGGSGPVPPSAAFADAAECEVRRLFEAAATSTQPVDEGQLAAALAAVERDFVVISGGPGTGKTTTVARLLAGLVGGFEGRDLERRVALVAPTGKASARMAEAIRAAMADLGGVLAESTVAHLDRLEATTIHRLLGRSDAGGFRHGPGEPLPHDILVVDEVSMVSLSLMAHLLAAVRPGAKVILVGDPYQLASVEAGSVLGDVVGVGTLGSDPAGGDNAGGRGPEPPAAVRSSVRTLRTVHRQDADSAILELSEAIREGRGEDVMALLRSERPDVTWLDPQDPTDVTRLDALEAELNTSATAAVDAARRGDIDVALKEIGVTKVLCGLRRGPGGVEDWNRRVEAALRSQGTIGTASSYPGRPVMVTRNDYLNHVFNGDVGVAVRRGDRHQVWFPRADHPQMVEEVRLDHSVTQWAMSIHKSQGSEFPHAVVVLPAPPSRILTRELLYTGVTRAKERLTILAGEAALRSAVERPIARASGLHLRLSRTGGRGTSKGTPHGAVTQ